MKPSDTRSLLGGLQGLHITSTTALRQVRAPAAKAAAARVQYARPFSTTKPALGNWLEPKLDRTKKMAKGRVHVPTGGSTKGTTVMWGDYGLRLADQGKRISAKHLKVAEDTIKARLRGEKYRLYKRKCCNLGVYVSGNDMRMGKGKGSFDHWAARVGVSQILFEIRGRLHEAVVRDAFRLAGNKLPGQWRFVKKGEPPVVGVTPLDGVTLEDLKRPRRQVAPAAMLEASSPTSGTEAAPESKAATTP